MSNGKKVKIKGGATTTAALMGKSEEKLERCAQYDHRTAKPKRQKRSWFRLTATATDGG